MKKYLSILIIICLLFLTACSNEGSKFKEEYEALNNKDNNHGGVYRTININKKNPFVHVDAKEIVKMIEEEKTFYVYFGDTKCPWCRSVIEKAIEVANDKKIKTIYYVNIWDEEHNEILRDTYKLDENGNAILVKEGTDSYQKLLESFENVLSDYTLSSKDNKVNVGEKRIYAPNFIYVKSGKAIKLESGIPSTLSDSNGELTKEMLEEETTKFAKFFTDSTICTKEGC